MPQRFKSVYFTDHPSDSSSRRNVKIAFGPYDHDLYDEVKLLSGQEIRELLGFSSYSSLREAAINQGLPLNTFCLRILREKTQYSDPPPAQKLLPMLDEGFEKEFSSGVDPIQATFRGGKAEPLHEWYPYLEGYSPEFVKNIILNFAQKAEHIFDPFSGTGTTPLTAIACGRQASYCEINPLLQSLINTKALALTSAEKSRHRLAQRAEDLAQQLPQLLNSYEPDTGLAISHQAVFGKSIFFSDDAFGKVLRLRTLLDDIDCEDPDFAQLATIAVLGSLIKGSKMIRRGDLRYRTEFENKRSETNLIDIIANRFYLMANDLRRLKSISINPLFVCEDARSLDQIPFFGIDAVITSPPYLNGTNYFRNTKIELWFLRCLNSNKDLANFRYRSVTAGINDVTVHKPSEFASESVKDVYQQLKSYAYDARIPLMVKSYFHDMSTIIDVINAHLNRDATLAIDIGDSAYSGIHIPTHQLLAEIIERKGFSLEKQITLRKRMSRGGIPLTQTLLVLNRNGKYKSKKRTSINSEVQLEQRRNWSEFKDVLPHRRQLYAKRNWGHPLHSLCSYQGKMKPSLAHHLVKMFVPSGGKMLDPFGGVGTIAFEAALQGMQSYSFEISPAAFHITKAKLGIPDEKEAECLVQRIENYIKDNSPTSEELEGAKSIKINGPLINYFHPKTLSEILLARRFFINHPPKSTTESLVFASLLHILHGNRPYALSRRSHPITPFSPTGPTEYRPLIPRLTDKVNRSLDAKLPFEFVPGKSLMKDATSWWPQEVSELDAIITSPPFFDSTRFYLGNWMRLWFAGWNADDFKKRPRAFVDERQKNDFSVYEPVLRQARERIKPGGAMVLHLGKSKKCDMGMRLTEIAKKWFTLVDIFSETVEHCESHGIRDKGTVREHTYMILN